MVTYRAIELEEHFRVILCHGNCKQITYVDADELSEEGVRHVALQFSLHITRKLQHDIRPEVLHLPN
jgi:hypothetical protein